MKEAFENTEEKPREKIKVTKADIIVTGTKKKPYFEIKYKEVGKKHYNIGYSSYDLNNVFKWREEEMEIVSEVEAEYGNGWIPCSERLPEKENVLCYAVSLARNPDTIFVGAYSNGVWFLQSAIATISYPTQYKVIAWMPLPSPYTTTTD